MTHLVIQQKKVLEGGTSESVSSAFIAALYNITNDSNLIYQSTDLKGDLSVDKTYQNYIDFLTARYPNLTINATATYLYFADPVVESIWANSTYGDGVGITATNAALVSSLSNTTFKNNTSITSFDELANFTSITTISSEAFKGCSNLQSIDLSNITSIAYQGFMNCSSLTSVGDISKLITLGRSAFYGCSSLSIINPNFSSLVNIDYYAFENCSELSGTMNLSNVYNTTYIGTQLFAGCSKLEKIIIGTMQEVSTSRSNSNRSTFYQCTSLKVVDINQLNSILFSNNVLINNDVFQAFIIRNKTTIPSITLDQNTTQALWGRFTTSPIAKIYVDDSLYSTYINNSDWSDLASHIDIISNYNPS